jgi:hypothetical protein
MTSTTAEAAGAVDGRLDAKVSHFKIAESAT